MVYLLFFSGLTNNAAKLQKITESNKFLFMKITQYVTKHNIFLQISKKSSNFAPQNHLFCQI